MATKVVNFEGRKINVPADATDDEVASILHETSAPRSDASTLLTNRYVIPQDEDKGREFMSHLARPIANLDHWSGAALKDFHIDTGGEARYNRFNRSVEEDRRTGKIRNNSAAALAGDIVGTLPATLATRNPLAANMASSALTSTAETPGGVASDAIVGGLTGKLGDAGTRAVGAVVAPHVNPMVRRLMQRGVTPTLGQIVGGKVHNLEDAATSSLLPFVTGAQERSLHDYNKAFLNEGLQHIGARVPDNVRAGHPAVEWAQNRFNSAYNQVKQHLVVRQDPQFHTDLGTLRGLAQNLPAQQRRDFNRVVQDEVLGRFSQPGSMSGHTFKEVEEILGKEVKDFSGNNATPHERRYADAMLELQAQMRDLAMRSNPRYATRLQAINDGYALLTRAEKAAAGSKGGIATPAALRNAVVQSDFSVRKRASAAGQAIGQDLAIAGEDVLPKTVPDSGTTSRAVVAGGTMALLGAGGAGAAALGVNPLGAAALGGLLLPYTRTGQRVTAAALTRRPAIAAPIRRGLQRAAPVVGRITSITEMGHRNQELPEDR